MPYTPSGEWYVIANSDPERDPKNFWTDHGDFRKIILVHEAYDPCGFFVNVDIYIHGFPSAIFKALSAFRASLEFPWKIER